MRPYRLVFFLLFGIASSPTLSAQTVRLNKYWVEFTDKKDSPYCTCRPTEILSPRALARRTKAGIAVVDNDLPVNPDYVNGLKINGVQIHHTSRWLNAATVIADSAGAASLVSLPFVKKVQYVGRHIKYRNQPNLPTRPRPSGVKYPQPDSKDPTWGYATLQNSLLGIPTLQMAGYKGQGIWIGVMDGGFFNADIMPFFDSVALQGRLRQGWDFVEHDSTVYEDAPHGTAVLSTMAANLPGYMVGTAPGATYLLIKTEDIGGEFPVEEANWIAGAEWADSIGVDVINASLGYNTFNDTTLNHTYADLDGHSSIAARGATIAAQKGMIICNAAGNSGSERWRYLGVPADAPGIIAVGAVDLNLKHAKFSSYGPTADGRIKPDLCAPGDRMIVAGNAGSNLSTSSGTSLASPMMAGSMATLWSAYPDKTAKEILAAVFQAADQTLTPDNERGYGVPDFTEAWIDLGDLPDARDLSNGYDAKKSTLSIALPVVDVATNGLIELRNSVGQLIASGGSIQSKKKKKILIFSKLDNLKPGVYVALVQTKTGLIRIPGKVK